MQLQLELRNDLASLEDAVAALESRLLEHALPRPVVDDARHGRLQEQTHRP